jgi:hypothetical protein
MRKSMVARFSGAAVLALSFTVTGPPLAGEINFMTNCKRDQPAMPHKDCVRVKLAYISNHPMSTCPDDCQRKCGNDRACYGEWAQKNAAFYRERAARKGIVLK